MINLDLSIARARAIANNDKYGYSQPRRDEEYEGDCSSDTVDCLNAGGFNFSPHLTTDTMLAPLLAAGFVDVTKSVDLATGKGLLSGDVCLRPKTKERGGHVILALAKDGSEIFQNAGDFDGKRGDSSGKEICIRNYYNSPFKYVLRYQHTTNVVLPVASAPLASCPYVEPTTIYTPRNTFKGNDARWFEWQFLRIGYTPKSIGCTDDLDEHGTDGVAGSKVWAALGYEMSQGHNAGKITSNVCGKQIRDYLKSCKSK